MFSGVSASNWFVKKKLENAFERAPRKQYAHGNAWRICNWWSWSGFSSLVDQWLICFVEVKTMRRLLPYLHWTMIWLVLFSGVGLSHSRLTKLFMNLKTKVKNVKKWKCLGAISLKEWAQRNGICWIIFATALKRLKVERSDMLEHAKAQTELF